MVVALIGGRGFNYTVRAENRSAPSLQWLFSLLISRFYTHAVTISVVILFGLLLLKTATRKHHIARRRVYCPTTTWNTCSFKCLRFSNCTASKSNKVLWIYEIVPRAYKFLLGPLQKKANILFLRVMRTLCFKVGCNAERRNNIATTLFSTC